MRLLMFACVYQHANEIYKKGANLLFSNYIKTLCCYNLLLTMQVTSKQVEVCSMKKALYCAASVCNTRGVENIRGLVN